MKIKMEDIQKNEEKYQTDGVKVIGDGVKLLTEPIKNLEFKFSFITVQPKSKSKESTSATHRSPHQLGSRMPLTMIGSVRLFL